MPAAFCAGGGMSETIPVIDIAGYLAGRPGELAAAARAVHDALTTVGFFVLTGHDVRCL
jgi:isopenicillin N synthase-like dioxygenase